MILRIRSELSAPPSSVTLFRDTTLFAETFCGMAVLMECEPGTRSLYWNWLKRNGAHDFIKDVVRPGEETGFLVGPRDANINVDRIDYSNFDFLRTALYALKS